MRSVLSCFLVLLVLPATLIAGESEKPLFKDFIGVNGHTVQFKPKLYSQVCRVVRDYHPMEWDTGKESNYKLDFPFARNRVNWEHVYGSWRKEGFIIDACLMFETIQHDKWVDMAKDSYNYGLKFAQHFGPSSKMPFIESAEVGNEPGKYSDEKYRIVFENMAKGLADGWRHGNGSSANAEGEPGYAG